MKIEIHFPPRFFWLFWLAAGAGAIAGGIAYPELSRAFILFLSCLAGGVILIVSLAHTIAEMGRQDTRPEKGWVGVEVAVSQITPMDLADGEAPEDWKGTDGYATPPGFEGESVYLEDEENVREDAAEVYERRAKKARVLKPWKGAPIEILKNDN